MTSKRCSKCGCLYFGDEVQAFFRANRGNDRCHGSQTRPVCIGCELSARTAAKERNRTLEKARRTRNHHADRFIREGAVQNRTDFAERYGWELGQMSHDIAHSSTNGCPYCRRSFSSMAHGLADITIDVVNPEMSPYYRTNCRWVCRSCNAEKQRTPPHLFAAKLESWRRYECWMASGEWAPDTLFGDWAAA